MANHLDVIAGMFYKDVYSLFMNCTEETNVSPFCTVLEAILLQKADDVLRSMESSSGKDLGLVLSDSHHAHCCQSILVLQHISMC